MFMFGSFPSRVIWAISVVCFFRLTEIRNRWRAPSRRHISNRSRERIWHITKVPESSWLGKENRKCVHLKSAAGQDFFLSSQTINPFRYVCRWAFPVVRIWTSSSDALWHRACVQTIASILRGRSAMKLDRCELLSEKWKRNLWNDDRHGRLFVCLDSREET